MVSSYLAEITRQNEARHIIPRYFTAIVNDLNHVTDSFNLPRHELLMMPFVPYAYGGGGSDRKIYFNRMMLDSLGIKNPAVESNGLWRAMIGHELYHSTQSQQNKWHMRILPLMAGPAVAMTALYLIERAMQKKPATAEEAAETIKNTTNDDVNQEASEAQAAAGQPSGEQALALHTEGPAEPHSFFSGSTGHAVLTAAKYAAAAALGFAAASWAVRNYNIREELRADAMGARAGGRENMIEMLKLAHGPNNDGTSYGHADLLKSLWKNYGLSLEKMGVTGEILKQGFSDQVWRPHPSLQQRITHLQGLAI